MDKELRPSLTVFSFLAHILGVILTFGVVIFLIALISGCAATNLYDGKVERSQWIMQPSPPRYGSIASGGKVWSYFDMETYGVYTIRNGTPDEITLDLRCNDAEWLGTRVAAHSEQRVLVITTMDRSRNGLCR